MVNVITQLLFFSQRFPTLDARGYCSRISFCCYSLGVPNFKLTYPSKLYPSAAPYSSLSAHFKNLVKEGLMQRLILKSLLYPELFHRSKTINVRLRRRHHSQNARKRLSICSSSDLSEKVDTNEDDGTSETSSIGFIRFHPNEKSDTRQNTFVDYGPGVAGDCTKDIFACFEKASSKNGNSRKELPVTRDSDGSLIFTHEKAGCDTDNRDSLRFYSKPVRVVIQRNDSEKTDSFVHTSTAELIIGNNAADSESTSESTGTTVKTKSSRSNDSKPQRTDLACEDLVNLDYSMEMKTGKSSQNTPIIDDRHSMPNLFVGNRFNCSSLTEVFIPSYGNKREIKLLNNTVASEENKIPFDHEEGDEQRQSSVSSATTHSSSIDIPAMIPAPDQLSTELLYNSQEPKESKTLTNQSLDTAQTSSKYLIKPPSMFENNKCQSIGKETSPFNKHTIDSDKKVVPRRLSKDSKPKDKRCISYHYINLQIDSLHLPQTAIDGNDTSKMDTKKCGCCTSSPCHSPRSSDSGMAGSFTISPDAPITQVEPEYAQFYPDVSNTSSSTRNRNSGLMHSQSSHNFGRFNEFTICDNNNHDSGQYGHSNYEHETEQPLTDAAIENMFDLSMSRDTVKRQSRCLSEERTTEHSNIDSNKKIIYKNGLYAHWWKKEILPTELLRDIIRMKMRGRLQQLQERDDHNFNPDQASGQSSSKENPTKYGWGSGKTLSFCFFVLF